jgi:leader peptidase (prepilin peptidase)/N-methyltransferase
MVLAFILGLCIGSFGNVILARIHSPLQILCGRSHCPHCHRMLSWYELIPLISFIALKGHCRTCKKAISWRYPLVEVTTGVLWTLFYIRRGIPASAEEVSALILVTAMTLLFFFDISDFILPDVIVFPLIAIVLGISAYSGQLISDLLVGFLLSSGFAILYVVSGGRWVGFGDVKLVFLIGMAFGFPFGPLVVIGATWVATLVGVGLLTIGKATPKTALPFGAFLAAASIFYILYAHEIEIFRWSFT